MRADRERQTPECPEWEHVSPSRALESLLLFIIRFIIIRKILQTIKRKLSTAVEETWSSSRPRVASSSRVSRTSSGWWALDADLQVLWTWLRRFDRKPNTTSLDGASLSFVITLTPRPIYDAKAIVPVHRSIWVAVNVITLADFGVLESDPKSGVSRVGVRHDLVVLKVVEMFSDRVIYAVEIFGHLFAERFGRFVNRTFMHVPIPFVLALSPTLLCAFAGSRLAVHVVRQ